MRTFFSSSSYFACHFWKRRKFVLGLPKSEFSTGKKHFTWGKNQKKLLCPLRKICLLRPWLYHCIWKYVSEHLRQKGGSTAQEFSWRKLGRGLGHYFNEAPWIWKKKKKWPQHFYWAPAEEKLLKKKKKKGTKKKKKTFKKKVASWPNIWSYLGQYLAFTFCNWKSFKSLKQIFIIFSISLWLFSSIFKGSPNTEIVQNIARCYFLIITGMYIKVYIPDI